MAEQTCKLRDMTEEDIENYVRWFTVETEFNDWDAPWEPIETTEEEERKGWKEYLDWTTTLSPEDMRQKFEIEWDGRHVGWVCCYTDLEYMENTEGILALGIDIPEINARNKGCGRMALELFMDYLQGFGYHAFYLQTWSGNFPMLRLAEKLGFREVYRKAGHRRVEGTPYDAITLELRREA